MTTKYTAIDLFCGAGGLSLGFKQAGFQMLAGIDANEPALNTYEYNMGGALALNEDLFKVDDSLDDIAKKIGTKNIDVIIAGPPCQGFSMAGFRAADDPRNQLFREFVDIVKRVNPKVIVFENVEGLLSFQGGKTYREVHTLFSELGYRTRATL